MENVIDNQSTETQATEPQTQVEAAPAVEETPTQEPYKPFAAGKEKFKIDGEEVEWDWETTKKYAQLNRAGQRRMEQAAAIEKKHKELYQQLVQTAERDLPGLYEALTGKKYQQTIGTAQQPGQEQVDPKEAKIQELESNLSRVTGQLEQWSIEKEKAAVADELKAATEKYPELKNPFVEHFVKSEYRKALKNGMNTDLETVAFLVVQDWKKQNAQQQKVVEQKFEENKKRAPVITAPSAPSANTGGGIEEARRLAGRI